MDDPKDVYSINELDELNRLLQNTNDFLVDNEHDEVAITAVIVVVRDRQGTLIGSFTKYTKDEDIKFEPNFEPEVMG